MLSSFATSLCPYRVRRVMPHRSHERDTPGGGVGCAHIGTSARLINARLAADQDGRAACGKMVKPETSELRTRWAAPLQ